MSGPVSVYLDYNATAPIRPEAASAVALALEVGANPSSVHAGGRRARSLIEQARETVAEMVGASMASVIFTSGGAEANSLALRSACASGFGPLIVSAAEHETVLENARALGPVELWPVDDEGRADLHWLADRLARAGGGRPMVALMLANNETGVIQPVAEAGALVRDVGGWLHVDAVQAGGKLDIDIKALSATSLALSAHKLGGPQGVGALVAGAGGVMARDLHGGGQERGRRAGTENLGGIVGFAAAIKASADRGWMVEAAAERALAEARLQALGAVVIAASSPRLANTSCIAVDDWPSELQVMALDLAGVMVSAGAACSSGKVKASRVVQAMGLGGLAGGALRVSSGWASGRGDWARFTEAWSELHARRGAGALSAA